MRIILGLAPGNISYYDPISKMHFHLSNSVQEVREGVSYTNLKKAVENKTLRLIEGSFEPDKETPKKTDLTESDLKPLDNENPSTTENNPSIEDEDTTSTKPTKEVKGRQKKGEKESDKDA